MTNDKKTIQESINILNKPKTISIKLGILIAVLAFLLGIWVGFFAYSLVNAYFNPPSKVASAIHNIKNKNSNLQEKKPSEPKIVVVGSNQTSSATYQPASTNRNTTSGFSSTPEQATPKPIPTETVNPPAVSKSENKLTKKRVAKKKSVAVAEGKKVRSWTIQVASYAKKANAIHLLKRLASKSIAAHIKKVSNKKGIFYRVVISFKGTKAGLNFIVKKIEKRLHIKPFVYDSIS